MRIPILGIIVVWSVTLHATTFYVAPKGSDNQAGTLKAPLRTMTSAATRAHPGDVVSVRGGVYHEVVRIACSGNPSAYVVFRPFHGEHVVIEGENSGRENLVTLDHAAYVELTGFEVRNGGAIGICGWNSSHIRIAANTIHNMRRNGIYFGGDRRGIVSDITVEGNTVYHTVLENLPHTMKGGWASALVIAQCDVGAIVNNRVFENSGEGLGFLLSDHGRITGNEVFDNYSVEVYIDNARSIRVANNLIYSTGKRAYFRDGFPAAGIGTANESYQESNPVSDLLIVDNVVVNSRWGFYYGAYDNGGGLKNSVVANNTFDRSAAAMLWVEKDSHTDAVIENNTVVQSGGAPGNDVPRAGVTFRNNSCYVTQANAAGPPKIVATPCR